MQAVVVPTIVAHVPRFMSRIVARDQGKGGEQQGLETKASSRDAGRGESREFYFILRVSFLVFLVHVVCS